jgi:glycosyltransferase involved in cell wall biosynthesis
MNSVTLVGYPFSELGIGEDIRTTAKALSLHNQNFNLKAFKTHSLLPDREKEFHKNISNDLNEIRIFNMTAFETLGFLLEEGHSKYESGYNIGYWPWEFSEWPEAWNLVFDIVDEIWAPSLFLKEMYSKYTNKPVIHMPLSIDTQIKAKNDRDYFKLPKEKFIFFFMFDFNSYIKRKNPSAVIKAFKKAFPDNDDVVLLFKTHNSHYNTTESTEFRNLLSQDIRIRQIDDTLTKQEIYNLLASIDCFVSLHRSEGFGRCLAESMLLEKPVIATDFSGSKDFCNDETAFLVDFKDAFVQPGDYPHSLDFMWAEPSIETAAEKMVQVFNASKSGNLKESTDKAKLNIIENFSCSSLGARYKNRINEISKKITK